MNCSEKLDLILLCRVVDNFGDIGVVYRLARSLKKSAGLKKISAEISIVVSDLVSFSKMAPGISPEMPVQEFEGFTVYDWNNADICNKAFTQKKISTVLECFQCGRPDWLEEILFAPENKNVFHIINVEYLTAEDYADDFHLLKSATRSSFVKKINFMPGFTDKTGGLILGTDFIESRSNASFTCSLLEKYLSEKQMNYLCDENCYKILIFAYEKNFTSVVNAINRFYENQKKKNPDFYIEIFAANGKSFEPFRKSAEENNACFELQKLPFLPQQVWDALMTQMNFNFIRGEDSLSRACLAGIPFIWHAYLQDEEYQLVKVQALLERLMTYFPEKLYSLLSSFWISYNRNEGKSCGDDAFEILEKYSKSLQASDINSDSYIKNETEILEKLLENSDELQKGFTGFSDRLISFGCLSEKLIDCCINFPESV